MTVALDLRGHGGSPDGVTHTAADMARDVLETLEQAGFPRDMPYVVVGHAMGGKIALRLAAMQPPRLRGLVLIAPSPPTPGPLAEREQDVSLAAWGNEEASRAMLTQITGLPVADEDADQFTRDRARTSRAAWQAWFSLGRRENIGTLMNKVLVPAVVLIGANDLVVPPEVQRRETVGHIRNAFLSIVPNAGHLLPYEAPEATADIIASCLPSFT